MYVHNCVYNFKRYWQIKENEMCLPHLEAISGHKCQRTNIAAKCEIFMNYSKDL